MLQFRNIALTDTMSSFELRVVLGLFVLCVLQLFFVQAIKAPKLKTSSSGAVRRRVSSILTETAPVIETIEMGSLSRTLSTSTNSLVNMNLRISPSNSLNLQRAASSASININNSPSLMRESVVSHSQAAFPVLNQPSVHLPRNPTMIERMTPTFDKFKPAIGYLKTGGIAAAGAGGIITIINSMRTDGKPPSIEQIEEKLREAMHQTIETSTTMNQPEYHNPLGIQYK